LNKHSTSLVAKQDQWRKCWNAQQDIEHVTSPVSRQKSPMLNVFDRFDRWPAECLCTQFHFDIIQKQTIPKQFNFYIISLGCTSLPLHVLKSFGAGPQQEQHCAQRNFSRRSPLHREIRHCFAESIKHSHDAPRHVALLQTCKTGDNNCSFFSLCSIAGCALNKMPNERRDIVCLR